MNDIHDIQNVIGPSTVFLIVVILLSVLIIILLVLIRISKRGFKTKRIAASKPQKTQAVQSIEDLRTESIEALRNLELQLGTISIEIAYGEVSFILRNYAGRLYAVRGQSKTKKDFEEYEVPEINEILTKCYSVQFSGTTSDIDSMRNVINESIEFIQK